MTVVTVKEYDFGSEDYEACKLLRHEILRKPLGMQLSAEDIANEEEQFHFSAKDKEGNILGTVTFKPIDDKQLKLRQMAIAEDAQGTGIGKKIVQQAETILKAKGFKSVQLTSRVASSVFYQKLGYNPDGDAFTTDEVTVPVIRMIKTLG